MAVETRVIIDANAQNAIREIDKLDTAAADADTTINELDGQTVNVDTTASTDGMDRLRQMGDEAIASVKALDDQRVDIDVDVDKLDNVKTKIDQVEGSGKAAGTAIGGIGGSISELPGIGSLGPIAESLGQLTENALEGGESIGGLTKAIGILGGTALVMQGIQKVMASIAETKAFNTEKAKAFKDSIDDVGDSANAVLDVIKETQSVTGRAGGIFGTSVLEGTKDITRQLDAAGVSVEDFTRAVQSGGPALDEAVGKLGAMQAAAEEAFKADPTDDAKRAKILEYSDAIEILRETHKTYADQVSSDESWSNWIAGGDTAKATTEAWNQTLELGVGWLKDTASSMDGATGKTKDLAAAYGEARRKADDLTYANSVLRGDIDRQDAYIRLQGQLDELKVKGKEAWDAAATGADDAESKMREYQGAQNDAKNAVIDFNDEWGQVDFDQTVNMTTRIDRGEFDALEGDLAVVTSRTQLIDVRVRTTVDAAWNAVTNRLNGNRGP